MQASLQRHGAGAGFLSEGQAAIEVRPSLACIRELMSKRRGQRQARRATVMPQAVIPVRAFQQLDVRSRDPLQGGNADGRIPGATFLPEVRPLPEVQQSSRVSLATIHAQMAMGGEQRRRRNSRPHHSSWGQRAEAQVHVVDGDGGAVGAGRRRVHQEARGRWTREPATQGTPTTTGKRG